ncbi:ABC-2 family transporter [Lachnotalea glycerini]|uniref:ABC-2 family transporter n=1 Tax=Lachnotalea glycerini TaxID=1763509 RepID=A0A318EXJ7_9FIRM|nr:ABC transporter permease [Lachnotalea glycerini]PXV95774.1 ABC-2 family transporter [Lachnotalea glycerini]
MRLNPVFEKELRMFERSVKISWVIFVYNFILACVALIIFYEMLNSYQYTGSIEYENMIQIYIVMAYIQFAMLILIIPGLTAGAISGERERQTLDILLSTQMKPWQIIIGKLQSSLSIVLLLTITSMPIVSVIFIFGGIKLIDLSILIILLVVEAVFIGTIGLLFSSAFKKSTTATVLTYAALLFIFLGSYLIVQSSYIISQAQNAGLENTTVDIKGVIYVLLINPMITFSGLISRQAGNTDEILTICNKFGDYNDDLIVKYWVIISMSIQLALSVLFVFIAQAKINPLRECKLFKKRSRNKKVSSANT